MEYGKEDVGCYADGAAGMEHVNEVLEKMSGVKYYTSDDGAWDREALDALQSRTEDGVWWTFECGDLILTDEDADI